MTAIRAWIALALLLLPSAALGAPSGETLVSVRSGVLSALPVAAQVARLLPVDGQLVALGADSVAVLDSKGNTWSGKEWRPAGVVTAVARAGYLLVAREAGGPVAQVEKLSLKDGAPVSSLLPTLPLPLAKAQGGTLGDFLYVAGTAPDGTPRLYSLNTVTALQWVAHDGWPGGGEVTSVVGQTAALQVTVKIGRAHV